MRTKWALVTICVSVVLVCACVPHLPVLDAAEEGDLEKLKLLLKQGRSINEQDPKVKFGWTPLIAAIYQDQTNVVKWLLESGADPNRGDRNGQTPLMWAMAGGDAHAEVVKSLIAHGADVFATNSSGACVLSYASSDPPKPKLLEIVKAEMLKQGGAKK